MRRALGGLEEGGRPAAFAFWMDGGLKAVAGIQGSHALSLTNHQSQRRKTNRIQTSVRWCRWMSGTDFYRTRPAEGPVNTLTSGYLANESPVPAFDAGVDELDQPET